MPPETVAPPTPADTGVKQTAANIVKGVTDKATGKVPAGDTGKPEAAPKGSEQPAADPNAGKRKYNVSGKDVWLTPEQADAYVQKGLAFEPKISELDRIHREMAAFERAMIDNPGGVLANLAKRANVPVQAIVEKVLNGTLSDEVKETTGKWYWENVAKRQRMDPKDLQILEQDERIKALEAQDKQKAEMAVALENRNKVVQALGQVSAQIQETLGELGITDVNSALAIRMTKEIADVMRLSYLSKQPCTAKQAAEKVRERINSYQRQFYDALDMDKLVEQLGKENAEKVRKYFLKLVQDPEKAAKQEGGKAPHPPKRDERKTMNMDDFHDYLDDLKKNSK